jgi:topoisomerase IA-like protein
MPKQIKNKKSPAEMNPLVEYLVDESVREGGVPDRATNEQISLLVAETGRKGGEKGEKLRIKSMAAKDRKSTASKAAKAARKKAKKPGRRG